MDNGVLIRPVQPSSMTPVRTEYAGQRQAVRTELPETAAVISSAAPKDVRQDDPQRTLRAEISTAFDGRQTAGSGREAQRKVSYNNEAREVVISRIDPDTGSIINQYPDDSLLRQKAYVRQVEGENQKTDRTPLKYIVA
jgi:uncharacterized FlaG/YvyC family protein